MTFLLSNFAFDFYWYNLISLKKSDIHNEKQSIDRDRIALYES
jgi:hypothetical protein